MANQTVFSFNVVILVAVLLVFVSIAEGGLFGIGDKKGIPQCESVHGVANGDTCFGITQAFNMTTQLFDDLNPNLNCTALFVGEWICVRGEFHD